MLKTYISKRKGGENMSRKKMYRCVWMSLCVLVFTLMIACVCSIKSNAIITQPKGLENQVSHTEDVSDVSKSDKVDTVSRPEVKVSEIDSETVSEKATDDTSVTADTAQPAKSSNYTVDFAYDKLQYSIKGGTTVPLSDILHRIGISGTVSDVQCSDTSLFSATQTSGSWMVISRRAFSTTELMRVTVDDRVHEITVTDAKDGDWEYADNADGTVTIMRYCGEDGVDMNIPDKLDDKSVTALDKDVFESYYGIKSITIPKSVTSISNDVFSWCDSLEKIEVDSKNKKYLAKDGALYEKNEADVATKLVCCPRNFPNKSLTLPPTVDDISNLQYCENLERIYAFKKFDDLDDLMGVDKSMLVLICEDLGAFSLKNKKRVKIVDFHEILGCEEVYTIYCNDIAEEYAISAISQELGVKITLAHDESVGIQDTDGVHSYCGSKEYAVKFVNDNGIELQSSAVIYGKIPSYIGAIPTKEADAEYTYTFAGWTPEITEVIGDATYTATYDKTINKYQIIFVDEDGKELQSSEVEYGQTPSYAGETPTKAETDEYTYTFAGWTPEITEVTGDAAYKATCTAKKKSYTITWKNDDGAVIDTTAVDYGAKPTHDEPTKAATAQYTYTFAGWTPEITEVIGDATYTATYDKTINKYQIIFVDEDGKELQSSEVEYGQTPSYAGETPTKAETDEYTYTFAGWTPEITEVTGDAAYKATCTAKKKSYTITWKNDDGAVIDTTAVDYGVVPIHISLSKGATAKYTYKFVGWTPALKAVASDTTYTAKYVSTLNQYTVTFVDEDGTTVLHSSEVEYDKIPSYGDTPTKAADGQYKYTFAGWTPKIAAVTGNAIYTAQYEKSLIDDLNGDGKVDIEDMILLSRQLVNKSANVTDQYEKSFIDDVNGDDKVYINDWAYLVEKSSCTPKNGTDNNITRSELVTVLQRCLEGVDVNEDFAVSDNKWFGISQTKLLATSLLNYIEKSRRSEGSLIMTEQSTSNNPLYDASDIKDNGKKIGEIYTFDLTLKVSDDNGKTWKEYKLNLERPEAEIIIQYPDGISKDTDPKYVEILHFLENGTSEQIKFTFEDDGIHMKVSGLSPFAIIRWSESTDDMSSQELQEYKTDEGKVLDDSSKSEVASKSDPSSKSENEKLLADDVDYVAEREVVKTADTMTIESLLGLEMLMLLSLIGLYFSLKRKKV